MGREIKAPTQSSMLTAGRVMYVGVNGLHSDSSLFTFNDSTGVISATSYNGGATLTGTPTAPTAPTSTNTTQIATTAFVQTAVAGFTIPSNATFTNPIFNWPTRSFTNSAAGEILHADRGGGIGNGLGERYQRTSAFIASGALPGTDIARWDYNFVEGDSGSSATHSGRARLYLSDQTGENLAIDAKSVSGVVTVTLPGGFVANSYITSGAISTGVMDAFGTTNGNMLFSANTTSTGAQKRQQGSIVSNWIVSTEGSQTGRVIFNAVDSGGVREGIRIDSTGSVAQVGFGGAVNGSNLVTINGTSALLSTVTVSPPSATTGITVNTLGTGSDLSPIGISIIADATDGGNASVMFRVRSTNNPVSDTFRVLKGGLCIASGGVSVGSSAIGGAPSGSYTINAVVADTGVVGWSASSNAGAGAETMFGRVGANSIYLRGNSGVGVGSTLQLQGKSSTTSGRPMLDIADSWIVNTDASRTSRTTFNQYDSTGAREALRLDATGTAVQLGVVGGVIAANVLTVNGNMSLGTGGNLNLGFSRAISWSTAADAYNANPSITGTSGTISYGATNHGFVGSVGINTTSPATALDLFGSTQTFSNSSSTTKRTQADIVPSWVDSTDASRKSRLVINAYDTAVREGIRVEASGTAAQIGVGGAVNASNLLTVNGTVYSTGKITVYSSTAGTNVEGLRLQNDGSGTGAGNKLAFYQASNGETGHVQSTFDSTFTAWVTAVNSLSAVSLRVAGSDKAVVTSTGLGVGTITPASALDLFGSATQTFSALTTSTGAQKRSEATIVSSWISSVEGSQKGRLVINSIDSAGTREGLRIDATGTQAKIGILGAVSSGYDVGINGNVEMVRLVGQQDVVINSGDSSSSISCREGGTGKAFTFQAAASQYGKALWNGVELMRFNETSGSVRVSVAGGPIGSNIFSVNGTLGVSGLVTATGAGANTFGSAVTTDNNYIDLKNGTGHLVGFVSGGSSAFVNGTIIGDAGLYYTAGQSFFVGKSDGLASLKVAGDTTTIIAESASGVGSTLSLQGRSSTTTRRGMMDIVESWISSTDASRTSRSIFNQYDSTGAREAMRIDANGTAAQVAFLGATHGTDAVTVNGSLYATGAITGATPADGSISTQVATAAFVHKTAGRYNAVTYFGMDPTGTSDCTALLLSALTTIHAAGGGVLYFPIGIYRFNGRTKFPYTLDGSGGADINPVVMQGASASPRMASSFAQGTVFRFYDTTTPANGEVAQFDLRARGSIQFNDITFHNTSTASTVPFVQTTNTQVDFYRCMFLGRIGLSLTSCNQDAIKLGGTTQVIDLGDHAAFQGYQSVVEDCAFSRIRTGVWLGTYANSIKICRNTWDLLCGGGSTDAAIVIDSGTETSGSGAFARGNLIEGNLFEMPGYKYAIKLLNYATGNRIWGNEFWDPAAYSPSYAVWVTSLYNSAFMGASYVDGVTYYKDDSGTNNVFLYEGTTNLYKNVTILGADPLTVEATAASNGGVILKTGSDRWRFWVGDAYQFYFTRQPNGGADHTLFSLLTSAGDNNTHLQLAPKATGGVSYFQSQLGGAALMAYDGYDAYFGNGGNFSAFKYQDSTDHLVASAQIDGTSMTLTTGLTIIGANIGTIYQQSNGDKWQMSSSDVSAVQWIRTPNAGSPATVMTLAYSTGDNTARIRLLANDPAALCYFTSDNAHAAIAGYTGKNAYLGNLTRVNALYFDGTADKIITTVPITAGGVITTTTGAVAIATGTGTTTGASNDYHRFGSMMTGGGTISWNIASNSKLKWTSQLSVAPVSNVLSTDEYIAFPQPTSNITDCYNGTRTADSNGVVLNPGECLWAVHTVGGSHSSIAWKITHYSTAFTPASNWIQIAVCSFEDSAVYLSNGVVIPVGGTVVRGAPYLIGPTIGPSTSFQHTVPAVVNDTLALLNAQQTLKYSTLQTFLPKVVALTDAATILVDASTAAVMRVTLGGNRTMGNPSSPVQDGQVLEMDITQDGTGSRTLTWSNAYIFPGGTAPTLTTAINKTDTFRFRYRSSDAKWLCIGYTLNI